jgi:hypothetical protein
MGMKIEITRDFRHFRKGQILEPPAMLREFLFKCRAAKLVEEKPKGKTRGRPRKRNTKQSIKPKS